MRKKFYFLYQWIDYAEAIYTVWVGNLVRGYLTIPGNGSLSKPSLVLDINPCWEINITETLLLHQRAETRRLLKHTLINPSHIAYYHDQPTTFILCRIIVLKVHRDLSTKIKLKLLHRHHFVHSQTWRQTHTLIRP